MNESSNASTPDDDKRFVTVEIDQPQGDQRHRRLIREQEKRRKTEIRGGRAYWITGLTFVTLGAIGLFLCSGMGDGVGIVFSIFAVITGVGLLALGGLILLIFGKRSDPK